MSFFQLVINKFSEVALKQEEKGIKKYGKELNPNNVDPETNQPYDWIEMAEEEFVDGFKYLFAERKRRDEVLKNIKEMTETMELFANDVDLVRSYCSSIRNQLKMINKNI